MAPSLTDWVCGSARPDSETCPSTASRWSSPTPIGGTSDGSRDGSVEFGVELAPRGALDDGGALPRLLVIEVGVEPGVGPDGERVEGVVADVVVAGGDVDPVSSSTGPGPQSAVPKPMAVVAPVPSALIVCTEPLLEP